MYILFLKLQDLDVLYVSSILIYLRFYFFIFFTFVFSFLSALKVEKSEGGSVDYNNMRVKQLKTLLDQRGVRCSGE